MEMIARGAFGSPDPHLVFMNSIIGYVLIVLYNILGNVPWFGIMHLLMAFFSLSAILYVFLNKEDKSIKYLALAAILITSYEAYTKVQFTKTAAYLAVAGYIVTIYALESGKINKIYGIVLLWLSFMVRPGMFFGASAVCLGFLLPKGLHYLRNYKNEAERNELFDLLKVGLCTLALVAVSFLFDNLSYRSEGWAYYKKFNEYRGQLYDVYFPSYDEFKAEYDQLGLSKEDRSLYDSGDMNDPDLFPTETMEKVISLQTAKVINLDEFVMFALRGYNTLFKQTTLLPFTVLALILLVFFTFNCRFKWSNWLSLILAGLMALLVFEYTYYMHGWFDRTTISIMFALIMTELCLMEPRDNAFNRKVSAAVLCLIFVFSLFMWNEYYKWNRQEWRQEYTLNHEAIDEVYQDREHIYFSRVSFAMWKSFYTPYDAIRRGTMANYATYGDWMINAPIYIDAMKKYDIVNPYKDIINNDKAYLIGYLDNLQPILNYIQRHYDPDAQALLVKNIGPYGVYSIKTVSN